MQNPHKILKISKPNLQLQKKFSQALGISWVLAQVLINRGFHSLKEAQKFLQVELKDLQDPLQYPDMSTAVKRIWKARERKEKVLLLGDYDVDGVTSLALLKQTLRDLGIESEHCIPHRIKEGYGLTADLVQRIKQKKFNLLVTADCGTNSFQEVKALKDAGIDVIITDHHEPASCVLPPADAIINPKIYTRGLFRDLAGVGVVFKLCQALTKENLFSHLDLVALGTIADVVPLLGENRIITRFGLMHLSATAREGLKALMKASRLNKRPLTADMVSFILGPRINASGRMDSAEVSFKLLLTEDPKDAQEFAEILERYNRQRQQAEAKILEEALSLIEKEIDFRHQKVIVLASKNWHEGVLGIAAAKLTDRFNRPTILISLNSELCKGSARSVKNFHLFNALRDCKVALHSFGGHAHAAGILIHRDKIADFKEKINRCAQEKLTWEDILPSIDIDAELKLEDLDFATIRDLEKLQPFGTANPIPLFYTRDLKLKNPPQVLSRSTLKFWVSDGRIVLPAIGFGLAALRDNLLKASSFDLVYHPRIDRWGSQTEVVLEVEDIFFH